MRALTVEINGRLYGNPPLFSYACPVCGRRMKNRHGNPQAHGFRISGFGNHIYACYEKSLLRSGFKEGKYDPDIMAHPLIRV